MAKVLSCKDVGVDCDFVARGETVEEIREKCRVHGKEAHNMSELPKDLWEKAKTLIHDE